MQAKLCKEMRQRDGNDAKGRPKYVKKPAGTIIDHPLAFHLVRNGCADPHDQECHDKIFNELGYTAETLAKAKHAQERTAAGIHPDDFAAFDSGKMIGYDADGNHIPGPNYRGSLNRRARSRRKRYTRK